MFSQKTVPLHNNSSFLRYYMKPYWVRIVLASICSLVLGLLSSILVSLVGPSLQILNQTNRNIPFKFSDLLGQKIGSVISAVSSNEALNADELLRILPIILFVTAGLKAFFYVSQSYIWENIGELISKDLRNDTIKAYLNQSLTVRNSRQGRAHESHLSASLTTDIKMIREYLVHFYGGFPREVLQVLFLTGVLLALSAKLFFIFLIFVLPIAYAIRVLGKKLKKKAKKALTDYSILSEWLQQRLLGIETIKHYKMEEFESQKFENLTKKLFTQFFRAAKVKARTSPMVEMIAVLALTGVLIVAMNSIEKKEITGAIAISFFTSLTLLAQSGSLIGRYLNSNREGAAAVDRVLCMYSFLLHNQAKPLSYIKFSLNSTNETIVCKNLTHIYPNANKPALNQFTYSFNSRKIYCVTGPSGSGKSTLFAILLNILEPTEGEVLLAADKHQNKIGYMPQSNILMRGSIAENIAYPQQEWDEKKIWNALNLVQLTSFVKTHPLGLNEQVGEGGIGLSGGQAQRILLSRIFYHNFKIILVDECTSALDPEVEQIIFDGLKSLREDGRTIIMIAHRTSALEIADEIINLADHKPNTQSVRP